MVNGLLSTGKSTLNRRLDSLDGLHELLTLWTGLIVPTDQPHERVPLAGRSASEPTAALLMIIGLVIFTDYLPKVVNQELRSSGLGSGALFTEVIHGVLFKG